MGFRVKNPKIWTHSAQLLRIKKVSGCQETGSRPVYECKVWLPSCDAKQLFLLAYICMCVCLSLFGWMTMLN